VKLPAVALAASFCAGIALGLWCPGADQLSSSRVLWLLIACAVVGIAVSFALLRRGALFVSATASLAVWVVIGTLGAAIAQQPPPQDFVLRVLQEKHIDLQVPLGWRVQLTNEPLRLPWGWRYDLALRSVEFQGETLRISGGLRLNYAPRPEAASPPVVHIGDIFSLLAQARLPQTYRNPGTFDRRAYLAQQGIDLVATLRAPELIDPLQHARLTPSGRLILLRSKLRDEVDDLCAGLPDQAAVLRAMLLGDRSFIDRRESTDFQKTGVFHVLVVAGLHVAAFATFLFWVGRKLRFSVTGTSVSILLALAVYVALVEQRPPVLRASLMAAVVLVASCFFRRLDLLNSAAVAALILLVANPLELRDSSFQLSFLAMGCIGGLGVPWLDRTVQPYAKSLRGWADVTRDAAHAPKFAQFRIDLRGVVSWSSTLVPASMARTIPKMLGLIFRFWELLLLTLVLQIGMLPVLASDFHRITLSGPAVNLIAVPLTGLIVPLGFLALLAGLLWHPLGALAAMPLHWATALLLHTVHWFAHFSGSSYRIPAAPAWVILAFFASGILLAACLPYRSARARRLAFTFAAALVSTAVLVATYPFKPRWTPDRLELNALDVGQGDSLFLISPKGRTLLIDGGGAFAGFPGESGHNSPDPGEEAVSPYLWSRGFKRIDVVALTHAHQDHAGGLVAVLENFAVGALWVGPEVSAPVLQKLEEEARARGVPVVHQGGGEPFNWDGAQLQFLWPHSSDNANRSGATNDDSLVLHLRYGNRSVLLPGDVEQQSEREMLNEDALEDLRADVLKVGHHGSKNSTTQAFLSEVRPEIGIISVGEDNPYGHPSAELLSRLAEAHVRILRTDRDGAVQVTTDGRNLNVSCFVPCHDIFQTISVERPAPKDQQHDQQQ